MEKNSVKLVKMWIVEVMTLFEMQMIDSLCRQILDITLVTTRILYEVHVLLTQNSFTQFDAHCPVNLYY